jgi:hypothetical protein
MRVFVLFLILIHVESFSINNVEECNVLSKEPDACYTACCLAFSSHLFYAYIDRMSEHHDKLIHNRVDYPEAISFSASFIAGISPESQFGVMPKIRGTYGIFSSEFSFFQLSDYGNYGNGIQQKISWQVLQINSYPAKNVNFKYGGGMQLYNAGEDLLTELAASLELKFLDQKVGIVIEGKYASDYSKSETNNSEISLFTKINLAKSNHVRSNLLIGASYNHFMNNREAVGLHFGLNLTVL